MAYQLRKIDSETCKPIITRSIISAHHLPAGNRPAEESKVKSHEEKLHMARVVLAESHELVCAGVRQFLRNHPVIELRHEARCETSLVSLLKHCSSNFDLILLAPELASTSDVGLIHRLRAVSRTPILIFTSREVDRHAVKLIRAGAQGYLNKKCSSQELADAILKVVSGRPYVCEILAEYLAWSLIRPVDQMSHTSLSRRETEIFSLLVEGRTVTQIAQILDLSVKTVSTHKSRIMSRMNFSSFSEMVQYAIANQLIEAVQKLPYGSH
jgi:DNA-binding NarL/FixJ family response regulator